MGDFVNRTYHHSLEWHKPLAWMRINIGYMRSELDELKLELGEETTVLSAILAQFEPAMAAFAAAEMNLFKAARTAERSPLPSAGSELLPILKTMSTRFADYISAFDAHVTWRGERHPDSATLALCHCCGGEFLTAHCGMWDALEDFKREIEDNLN